MARRDLNKLASSLVTRTLTRRQMDRLNGPGVDICCPWSPILVEQLSWLGYFKTRRQLSVD